MNIETVPSPTSILARLRTETRPEHDAIEGALDLMSETLRPEAYRRTLERFYGFYSPMEAALERVGGWTQRGLDMVERQKSPLLEADLRALGVANPEALAVCTDLPPHGTVSAAFGCLYVLEGATLGGQIIKGAVEKSLGVTLETGGRFFIGYGDRTGLMWQAFRTAVTAFAVTPADQDEAVAAAKATFIKLRAWIVAEGNAR